MPKQLLLLNGRAAWERKGLELALFVNNMTSARYFNYGYVDFDGSRKYFAQAPLNFFASIKYSFWPTSST